MLLLLFDKFQGESLTETEGTEIEIIGDSEKQQPDAVLFISKTSEQKRRKQKHTAHIGGQQGITASKMQDKPPMPEQVFLDFREDRIFQCGRKYKDFCLTWLSLADEHFLFQCPQPPQTTE